MGHPVIHAEIRSADPDATRAFFGELFGWKVASEGAFPGYTFIDTGAEGGTYVAISPRQSAEDEVLFFVGVEDVAATLAKAEKLGGTDHSARTARSRHELRCLRRCAGTPGRRRVQRVIRAWWVGVKCCSSGAAERCSYLCNDIVFDGSHAAEIEALTTAEPRVLR